MTLCRRLLPWAFALYAVSTLLAMAVMSISAAVLAGVLVAALGGPRGFARALRETLAAPGARRYLWASVALAAACALSLIGLALAPLVIGGHFEEAHLARDLAKAWYLFWPLALAPGLALLTRAERAFVLRAWILAFAALSVLGIFQHYWGWPRPQQIPGTDRFHATLFLGHHLSVASIFIFPFFAALDFLLKPGELGLPRWFVALALALGSATLFFTSSRMLWIALPVGLLAWILWNLPRRFSVPLGGVLGLGVFAASFHPVVRQRFGQDLTMWEREHLWKANLEFFRQRPLTGVGWHHNIDLSGWYLLKTYGGDHVFSGHAHNNFLDLLGSTGALGAAAWLAWCAVAVWPLWLAARRGITPAYGLLCAWLVFHLNGLTQLNFWEGKVEHQLSWVVAWTILWMRNPSPQATSAARAVDGEGIHDG